MQKLSESSSKGSTFQSEHEQNGDRRALESCSDVHEVWDAQRRHRERRGDELREGCGCWLGRLDYNH